jgi:hypothetical protein
MKVEVFGVYPVPEAEEPCHLVEVIVEGYEGALDVGVFTQAEPDLPREDWQAPWNEYLLNDDGSEGEPVFPRPPYVAGSARLAFFFCYLDPSRPLETPAGLAPLPAVTARPRRLAFVEYEPPD